MFPSCVPISEDDRPIIASKAFYVVVSFFSNWVFLRNSFFNFSHPKHSREMSFVEKCWWIVLIGFLVFSQDYDDSVDPKVYDLPITDWVFLIEPNRTIWDLIGSMFCVDDLIGAGFQILCFLEMMVLTLFQKHFMWYLVISQISFSLQPLLSFFHSRSNQEMSVLAGVNHGFLHFLVPVFQIYVPNFRSSEIFKSTKYS